MSRNKKIAVLYHYGCKDGFGAAWAAWRKFGARAEYIGVNHDGFLPKNLSGKDVYLLDFGYPLGITKKLFNIVKSLTAIDHHISVEKSTKSAHKYVYNLNHSGSVLAWKYFHSHRKTPLLLKHIEDIDIWKLALPNTRELMASLETYDLDFTLWNKIARGWENPRLRKKYFAEGKAILKYQNELIRKALKDAEEVKFMGKRALVANFALSLNSEIGDAMRKKGFQLGIIWQKRGDKIVVSLRSTNKVDSSKIAIKFGGGGHKKAASFRLPINQKFPWKRIKK
ncbi:hypothetical protein A2661_00055 [Candidatus Giovannonibacteria bacterium RIFCSPHIGHO2_01_FULL_45_24]|uniref:DHHA1 domain-containing protein n=1 Tax=Candidatus Giovannonibacteria bacterium RIFCSPLOWO2_01_FULL_46_32 TaxID=1798353 RepID=A0A1F5XIH9_9BACT|nr:MAG: hypothetical protein A2661_00055 [Candidatus Giovannonibacteria bacterium RIFCSPHIGHO2_01_FULL_45_24]OGF87679.1 MAG: hypothetical protein A3B19_01685 [Candidatus Giovannonibacteria bacterium RIFCSPLOWO2_01_FULL_46_32]